MALSTVYLRERSMHKFLDRALLAWCIIGGVYILAAFLDQL